MPTALALDSPVVVLEPWSPWPLVFSGIVLLTGAVLAIAGREHRWMRDLGYVLVVAGPLSGVALLGFLSGNWDQGQRRDAMIELGYEQPLFSGGEGIVGGTPGAIEFTAVRDGEDVFGQLQPLGGDRWAVVEGARPTQD
ncbi:hypothetical protein M3147_13875 [Agromyces mediolanus]|uniref:hypothetical protein n=1 Tax=Agromyces mediolanus TaxID=41986 RepID=UPI00203AE7BC|nr:hypothetical protein [Agromyces mediolanus]MCM3658339.1 hypothetical protein [Agromyces mediolanus]